MTSRRSLDAADQGFAVRLFAVLGSLAIAGIVFYILEAVLIPFAVAWLLAFLLVPLVDYLDRNMPRWLAIVLSFLTIVALLGGSLFVMVPVLQAQIATFLAQLPTYGQQLNSLTHTLGSHLHLRIDITAIGRLIQEQLAQFGAHLLRAPTDLIDTAAQLVKTLIFIALVPIVAFFLLRDWHRLVQKLETFVRASRRESVEKFAQVANEVLRHYIHGQLLVMVGVGIIYTLGYVMAGIDLGLVLGILAGVVFVIPFAAFVLTGIPAIVLAVAQFHDITHPLIILITIAIAELIGNTVLTPILVGRYVSVHPAAVLLLIFAGGALFGVFGMIVAFPLAAVSGAWISRVIEEETSADSSRQGESGDDS